MKMVWSLEGNIETQVLKVGMRKRCAVLYQLAEGWHVVIRDLRAPSSVHGWLEIRGMFPSERRAKAAVEAVVKAVLR